MRADTRFDFINTLRGCGALTIVVLHYGAVFWAARATVAALVNAPALSLQTHPTPDYMSWLLVAPVLGLGHSAVGLFFMISGFVIPGLLQRMSKRGFFINRVLRVLPTYFAGFTVTLAAVWISTWYFSGEWPFSTREVLIHYIPGIRDMLWSTSIDGVVWTLEIEVKFYLLCIVLMTWFRQRSLMVFLAPAVLFALAIGLNWMIPAWEGRNMHAWQLAMTYMRVSQYIIYTFIGVLFYYLHAARISAGQAGLGVAALFAMFCVHWRIGPYAAGFYLAWNYAFSVLIFAFAYSFPGLFKSNRGLDFLADISYPLYIIHGVAGYAGLRIMLEMGFKPWLSFLTVLAGSLLLSWLLHALVESPSIRLGKQLAAKLTAPLPLPASVRSSP